MKRGSPCLSGTRDALWIKVNLWHTTTTICYNSLPQAGRFWARTFKLSSWCQLHLPEILEGSKDVHISEHNFMSRVYNQMAQCTQVHRAWSHRAWSHRAWSNGKVWSRTQAVTRSWNEAGEGGEKKLLYWMLRHSEKLLTRFKGLLSVVIPAFLSSMFQVGCIIAYRRFRRTTGEILWREIHLRTN